MNIHPSGCWNSLPLKKNKEHPILQSQYRGQSSPCQASNKQGLTVRWAGPISTDRVEIVCSVPIHRNIARAGESYQKWCSSSSNFISNKYMKTSTYNTIALMITAMFTCTLLVATRKSRGLSSWLILYHVACVWWCLYALLCGKLSIHTVKSLI